MNADLPLPDNRNRRNAPSDPPPILKDPLASGPEPARIPGWKMDKETFKDKLDATHNWPCDFTFKFIMRPGQLVRFKRLFPEDRWHKRESAQGRYICVTMEREVHGADAVVEVYDRAAEIPGVMLL